GFWAYETLGWGGYWAWDPVENSSLIPWIFSAGLIHTLIIHRKKNALKRTGLALAILAFLSVTYGTFLTRSGVLGDFSVHSFLDLGINSYLIGAVFLFAGLGAVTFFLRFRQIKTEPTSGNWFSREFLIFGNILATILSAFLIILGMSSPLLTRWFGTPASVRTDFYNVSITPIVILFTLLLGLLPAVGWGENDRKLFWKNIRLPLMLSVPVAIAIFIGKVKEPLYLVFVFLSVLAFFSNGRIVLLKLKTGKLAGAFLAHCGMALLLLGVIFSNVYESRARIGLVTGEPQQALGYSFTYLGKDSNSPQGKTPHKILVQRGSEEFTAAPRQFFSAYSQGIMRTPYIKRYWNKDLYIAPIEEIDYSITEETFNLEKGKAFEKSGYTFRYLAGELSPHQTGTAQTFTAQIQVRHGEETETISPGLVGQGMNWKQEPARFNHDRAIVYLEGFQPGENSLAVRFIGQSANTSEVPQPGFAIEVSVKPFINLFWGGAILVVIGGILSLLKRWKALRKSGSQSNEAERVPAQPVARTLTGV
ncbi:MAG: cytochrome c biogenesis protein CcsA, partial [candidate division Zixibacteria bacterium]|nr:cytochrome c biogenesis protein CcsA [candidate division Zixibacteria bacterium]